MRTLNRRSLREASKSRWRLCYAMAVTMAIWVSGSTQALAVSEFEIGVLTCKASAGFDASTEILLICDFRAADGPQEAYSATIEEVDLSADVEGRIVWAVTSKKTAIRPGSLKGDYIRTPAGILVGGAKGTFMLWPRGIENASGQDLAHSVNRLTVLTSN